MGCATGKNGYFTEDEVQEALIRSQIRFTNAARNYYHCHDCSEYHLTSRGDIHTILNEAEVKARIKQERQIQDWEGRLRR